VEVDRALGILYATQETADAVRGILVDLAFDGDPAIAAGTA